MERVVEVLQGSIFPLFFFSLNLRRLWAGVIISLFFFFPLLEFSLYWASFFYLELCRFMINKHKKKIFVNEAQVYQNEAGTRLAATSADRYCLVLTQTVVQHVYRHTCCLVQFSLPPYLPLSSPCSYSHSEPVIYLQFPDNNKIPVLVVCLWLPNVLTNLGKIERILKELLSDSSDLFLMSLLCRLRKDQYPLTMPNYTWRAGRLREFVLEFGRQVNHARISLTISVMWWLCLCWLCSRSHVNASMTLG